MIDTLVADIKMVNTVVLIANEHGVLRGQEDHPRNKPRHNLDAAGNVIAEIVVAENARMLEMLGKKHLNFLINLFSYIYANRSAI